MKYVKLNANGLVECIYSEYTETFKNIPLSSRMPADAFAQLIPVEDNVQVGLDYQLADGEWKLFVQPENSAPAPVNPTVATPTYAELVTICSTLTADNKMLNAQAKAATEKNNFLENCIVEMAGEVYA